MCMWKRIWAGLKHLWAVLNRLEGVLKQATTVMWLQNPFNNQTFNPYPSTTPLNAPCVRLKPYSRRLEASLSRLEPSWRRLQLPWMRIGAGKSSELAKYLFFQPVCFNNTFWSVWCAFEHVFEPSWRHLELSWSILSCLEPPWRRLGASKTVIWLNKSY